MNAPAAKAGLEAAGVERAQAEAIADAVRKAAGAAAALVKPLP